MKKKILYFVWMIPLLFLGPVFGEDIEEFRGIKWGANKSEISGLRCRQTKKNEHTCERREELKVGDIKVSAIEYYFFKNQFYGAAIGFTGHSELGLFKDALSKKYGRSRRENEFLERYSWRFKNISVILNYSEVTHEGIIAYFFFPIKYQRDIEKEKEKEERGRKAKDDL